MALRLKQPNCGGCGPCAAGTIGTPTFVSRAGSGNLRGWSKFQNHNSGDWNTRKALLWTPTAADRVVTNYYGNSGCTSFKGQNIWSLTGVRTWNPSTNAEVNSTLFSVVACGLTYSSDSINRSSFNSNFFPPSSTETTFDFHVIRSANGAAEGSCQSLPCPIDNPGCLCVGSTWQKSASVVAGLEARLEVSNFDTIAAALARGSPTIGTSNRTLATSIGSTSAESTTQLAITGRSSTVTIPLTNLTPAQAYTIDITLNRYTAGGGAFVDTITVTVAFTAGATSEDLIYDVPVNTDFDYEFDSATNLVAV